MPEGFKAGAAYIEVDGDATVAIKKIESQIKAAKGRLGAAAASVGNDMGAKLGTNLERQLKGAKGRLGTAADGIGTQIAGKINSAVSKGLGGKLDASIGKQAAQVGDAVGTELGKGIDDGAARELGGRGAPKTKNALDSISSRSQAQFKGLVFAGAFAGLPAAAAVASVATIGALGAIPIALVAGAAKLQAGNEDVERSYQRLSQTAVSVMTRASSVLADDLVRGTDKLTAGMGKLEPAMTGAFRNAAPAVDGIVKSITSFADEAMPGILTATTKTNAAMTGLIAISVGAGRGVSDFFTNVSTGAEASARNGAILGRVIQDLLGFAGSLVSNLTGNTTALNSFANAMSSVYSTVLNLTQAGGAATGFLTGFSTVVSGALGLINGLSGALGGTVAPLLAMAGAFKAVDMLTAGKLTANLGAQFEGLGGKISAAEGARGKFQAGLSGLVSAAISPAGLAMGGLVIGLGLLGMAQQAAAQKAAEHKARIADLASSLRDSNGAINENVRSLAAKALSETSVVGSGKKVLEMAREQGVSLSDLTSAYLGNEGAQQRVNEQLGRYGQAIVDASDGGANLTAQQRAQISDNFALTEAVKGSNTEYGKAVQGNKDLAAAAALGAGALQQTTPAMAAAKQGAGELASAYTTLFSPMATVADRGNAIVAVMDRLAGRTPSYEESIQSLNDLMRGMSDAMAAGMDTTKGWGDSLINADHTISTVTENGSTLQNNLVALQSGFANAGASIQELVKGGMTFEAATAKVGTALQTTRDRFIETNAVMLGGRDNAAAVADAYGLIPANVTTLVTDMGSAVATRSDVDALETKLRGLPPNTPIRVESITAEAEQRLVDLNYNVTHMSDGSVLITSNAPQVQSDVQGVADRMLALQDRTVTLNVRTVFTTIGTPAPVRGEATAAFNHDGGYTKTVGGQHVRHRATGGPTPALAGMAGAAVYGERGMELGFPSRSEYVSTALQTRRMARDVASFRRDVTVPAQRTESPAPVQVTNHFHITAPPGMDVDALAAKISRAVERKLKGGS